jgi:hypothetical protein
LHKRLSRIDDKFFENKDQFRSVFLQTLQSQLNWSISDISNYKDYINGNFEELEIEDDENIQYSDRKVNNQYFQIEEIDEIDDFNVKNEFLTTYKTIITNLPLQKRVFELIVEDKNITNTLFSKATGIDLTSSAKIIKKFKLDIQFAKENYSKIRHKENLSIITNLHPTLKKSILDAISIFESNNPSLIIVLTNGFINSDTQKQLNKENNTQIKFGESLNHYGLSFSFKIAIIKPNKDIYYPEQAHIQEKLLEWQNKLKRVNFDVDATTANYNKISLVDAKAKYKNKDLIKSTIYINL